MTNNMTLYIANKKFSSWSLRPWLVLKHCGVTFHEVVSDHNQPKSQRLSFSPTGKVPLLKVDDGLSIHDSLAIIEYLAEQYPNVYPIDSLARAWSRMMMAEMHAGFTTLRTYCSMECTLKVQLHEIPDVLLQDIQRIESIWTDGLTRFGGPYLAGESFTAVDAYFAPVVFRFNTYQLPCQPQTQAYIQQMLQHSLMQQWVNEANIETYDTTRYHDNIRQYGRIV